MIGAYAGAAASCVGLRIGNSRGLRTFITHLTQGVKTRRQPADSNRRQVYSPVIFFFLPPRTAYHFPKKLRSVAAGVTPGRGWFVLAGGMNGDG